VALVNPQVESTTKAWKIGDVFDAALQTLINDRCRTAYVHDIRGGLQAVYSAFELLARSAKQGAASGTLIDKASALVKRAMANHEHLIFEIVNQLTVPEDEPALVNVTNLIHDVLRFLRNEASSRDIRISVTGGKDMQVSATLKLRTLLLGLLTLYIDGLPAGAELLINVSRAGEDACVELLSDVSLGEIRSVEALSRDQPSVVQPRDVILGGARYWLQQHGGRFVLQPGAKLHDALRIYYPLHVE